MRQIRLLITDKALLIFLSFLVIEIQEQQDVTVVTNHDGNGHENCEVGTSSGNADLNSTATNSIVQIVPEFVSVADLVNNIHSVHQSKQYNPYHSILLTNSEIRIYEHLFLDLQAEILAKLVDINGHLLELLRRTSPPDSQEFSQEHALPDLPIKTIGDLDSFNDWLNTEDSKSKLVSTY